MSEATHMELRTRRSALGDISVNVAAGTKATTKVGPEKRVTVGAHCMNEYESYH